MSEPAAVRGKPLRWLIHVVLLKYIAFSFTSTADLGQKFEFLSGVIGG